MDFLIVFLLLIAIGLAIGFLASKKSQHFESPKEQDPVACDTISKKHKKTSRVISTQPISSDKPISNKARSTKDIERIQLLPEFKVVNVIDGDTVIVSSSSLKIKIRLDSIDCPECGQEWGNISKSGLIKIIGGKYVRVEDHGTDVYDRTIGTLFVYSKEKKEWQNVNERMVTLGHAWVMRRFYAHLPKDRQYKLNRLESWARSKKVGLWKTPNPIPPWKWRNEG